MDKASETVILTNKDAAVMAIVYAITWFDLRTVTRERTIGANELELRAQIAGSVTVQTRHFP